MIECDGDPVPLSVDELAEVVANIHRFWHRDSQWFDRLAATLAELAQLRQDKERLDWLDRQGDPSFRVHWQTGRMVLVVADDARGEGRTAREAIDAARRSLPGALKTEKDNG